MKEGSTEIYNPIKQEKILLVLRTRVMKGDRRNTLSGERGLRRGEHRGWLSQTKDP